VGSRVGSVPTWVGLDQVQVDRFRGWVRAGLQLDPIRPSSPIFELCERKMWSMDSSVSHVVWLFTMSMKYSINLQRFLGVYC